jgi:hypothetical protein
MNPRVQQKMKQYQELAKRGSAAPGTSSASNNHHDGLTKSIRTKEDAAVFMAELKAATEQSK